MLFFNRLDAENKPRSSAETKMERKHWANLCHVVLGVAVVEAEQRRRPSVATAT